jgi:uncharacterized alkaline shock family protein YloU
MSRTARTMLILFSFLSATVALVVLAMILNADVLGGVIILFNLMAERTSTRTIALLLVSAVFITAILTLSYGVMSGRLRKTRVRSNDIGSIDIGVDALESIALNAAKLAQGGIKSAKARVSSARGDKINVVIIAVLYSDVEVPAMMTKVQERVKKDIERYTGIPVGQVIVRVSRVEQIAARVER